jgi:cyclophilin family peptidyl-prolyl cis-trans isomerase
MSTPDNPRELSSTEQEQVQQWLAEAELASKAEDWDRTVTLYRQALEFDRYLQGVEAKLQWAIRMRDTESLYQQGKSKLEAGQFEESLVPLRKARLMYASHYKDIDDLIVQAQSALQKEKWEQRPMARSAARKTQRQRSQRLALGIIAALVLLALIGVLVWTSGFGLFSPRPSVATGSTGAAGNIPPEQRNNMYKSAPEMQIDSNKNYRATIVTPKGNIIVDLYPKEAPQHVNNFVFLAREGFYNNLTFHRVEKDPVPFVIQGGDPLGNGTGGPGYTIPPEINRQHSKGALAMARRGGPAQTTPSSGSQFYITLEAQPGLDGQYTVFGQTTPDSMSIALQIVVGDVIKSITIEEK